MTLPLPANPAKSLRESGLMPSGPGYEAALAVAEKAFELIQEFQTPPIPKAYEICYAYAGGQPEQVIERIDAAVEEHGTLALHEIFQIHSDFFSYPEQLQARQNQTTDELDNELGAVLAMISTHLSSTNSYTQSLDHASAKLSASATPETLRQTVQLLIAESAKAKQEAQRLAVSLEASQASLTTMREKLAKAKEDGLRDALTNLRNRRHFDQALPEEIRMAREQDKPLCLVMVDIDRFKRINDEFGHPAGDAVLRVVGTLLADSVKGRDIAARYGGEEFAIILPETGARGAISLAERIRRDLEYKELVLRESNTSLGKITASFGVAELGAGDGAADLTARADDALLAAKQGGRNQVKAAGAA